MGLVETTATETSTLSGIHWCEVRMQPPFLLSAPYEELCLGYTALQNRFMYFVALSRIVFASRRQGHENATTGHISALFVTHGYK